MGFRRATRFVDTAGLLAVLARFKAKTKQPQMNADDEGINADESYESSFFIRVHLLKNLR